MVASGSLSDPQVRQWLNGLEPAWTMLGFDSFNALHEEPSATNRAIRLEANLNKSDLSGSTVARTARMLLERASETGGLKLTATGNLARGVDHPPCCQKPPGGCTVMSRADGGKNPMTSAAQRRSLEEAIVDTVREALVVLDDVLRVVVASRSFYRAFKVTPLETEGRPLYELGDGQWDIPALRQRLAAVIPRHTTVEEFEVEDNFPKIGRRTMLLNARKVFYEGSNSTSVLVAIEDVTERRALEREKDEFLRRKTSCCGRRICCSGR